MKISFHSVLLGLASCIGIQQSVIASPPSSSQQSVSTESAEALKQQFSIALAKQEKQQVSILQKKLTALFSLPPQFLDNQIQISEKILTRIFKTDKNLTPKFLDYLYFEPINTGDANLIQKMKKNLLVSFLANEQAKIYIRQTDNSEQFVQALIERGAKPDQIILLSLDAKGIFQKIIEQMRQDFPNQTTFSITENRVSLITPSSEIKPRLALANMMFARQFKGVEVDDFSYLDQARENLQHNNYAIRYKTFQAMLEGLN